MSSYKRMKIERVTERMKLWKIWTDRFPALRLDTVFRQRDVYTVAFAEQLSRCQSDDARLVLLGIREDRRSA